MSAIYFNSKLCTCKTVTGVTSLELAQQVLPNLCKLLGWKPEHVTQIKLA